MTRQVAVSGTAAKLRAEQEGLGLLTPEPWTPPGRELLLGGCFVAFERGVEGPGAAGDRAWAAAVAMRGEQIVARHVVPGTAGAPYEAGLLFLRAGRLLIEAVRGVTRRPDVVLVNGTGRDHPRRTGLALHLGALLDLPTVGVTDRPLAAEAAVPGDRPGDSAGLMIGDESVGGALRVRAGVNPVMVHAAWRTTPDVALEVARSCTGPGRTPEPVRQARRLARRARAWHETVES